MRRIAPLVQSLLVATVLPIVLLGACAVVLHVPDGKRSCICSYHGTQCYVSWSRLCWW